MLAQGRLAGIDRCFGLSVLSYKHAFHAGNHADLIKHLCWLGVLTHLKKKAKPFTLIDSHAGAGLYELGSEQSQLNKEFESGVQPALEASYSAPLLQQYQQLCQPYWEARQYPGSPLISASQIRSEDELHLIELHPTEIVSLRKTVRYENQSHHIHVHHRDAWEGMTALTPPRYNRGAVIIDPPYERKAEYFDVVEAVSRLTKRWRAAQIVVWYPLLGARAGEKSGLSETMLVQLADLGVESFSAQLTMGNRESNPGMYGSGVFVLNPAWQLDTQLTTALEEFCQQFSRTAQHSLTWFNRQ